MSGGSLDYFCWKIENIARKLPRETQNKHFLSIIPHLEKLAIVMHDIEWAIDGDIADDDAIKSIKEFLSPTDILSSLLDEAKIVCGLMNEIMEEIEGKL